MKICLKFHAQNYLHFKNIWRSKNCLIFIFALDFAATSKKTQDSDKYSAKKRPKWALTRGSWFCTCLQGLTCKLWPKIDFLRHRQGLHINNKRCECDYCSFNLYISNDILLLLFLAQCFLHIFELFNEAIFAYVSVSRTKCSSFSSLTMSKGGRGPLSEHLLVLFPVLLKFINSSFENIALHIVDKTCWTSLAFRWETNFKRLSCWLEPPDSSATTLKLPYLPPLRAAALYSLIKL